MTSDGGMNDWGNIFSIDTNGSGYKNLWNFNQANNSNGAEPEGDLILSGDKLYGMTTGGGINDWGNIFSIDTNGNGYKNLWNFNYAHDSNGGVPYGALTLLGGKLYGMTYIGGIYSDGNIFRIDTNGSRYKDLWDFHSANDSNGANPFGSLILSGGKLYGMTTRGGINDDGNIFRIDTNGNGYKDLWNFNQAHNSNGALPTADLTLSGGKFYGMTSSGGINDSGNIFSIDTNGSGYADLHDFNGINGEQPIGSLIISGSVLYGMTEFSGTKGDGVIFSLKEPGLGINDIPPTTASINVYPNPSNGVFTIEIRNYQLGITNRLEVYNILGEKVYSQHSTVNYPLSIDLSLQPNGVYLCRVIGENNELIEESKLIIEK